MALSGQKTVSAAGTAEVLGSQQVNAGLMIKALSANAGLIYIGNVSGDVAPANGLELAAGEVVIFDLVANLANIMLDAANNDDGVAWLILEA